MAILKKIIISLLPVLLTGCYETFTPHIDVTPVLCMNALITAGQPINVQVSRSWLFSDQAADEDHSVSDAVVSIIVNGELKDADYIPQEGDTVHLIAESRTYGKAEAEVTVPYAVPIDAVRWKPTATRLWVDNVDGWEMQADLTFNLNAELDITDVADSEDYYRFSYLGFYHSGVDQDDDYFDDHYFSEYCFMTLGQFQTDAEPIFSEHIGVFESIMGGEAYGFTFFTDRQFTGKTYPLHLQFNDCRYFVRSQTWEPLLLDCGFTFTIHRISRSYYDWVNYAWHREDDPFSDIIDAGFGEPIWGYSNVSTGAGIVAAEATSTYQINLSEFIENEILKTE